jgi:hypothetical protein
MHGSASNDASAILDVVLEFGIHELAARGFTHFLDVRLKVLPGQGGVSNRLLGRELRFKV